LSPEHWHEKPLGEVCEIYQPKTISQKEMVADGQYAVFGANGVIGRYDKYNHEDPQLLITCRGATCGSVNISEPFSWVTGNAMVVRPKDSSLDMRFTEYFFRGAIDLGGVITGAAQPQITRKSLAPVTIPIPSLDEQKRIVAVLDQAFAALDRARAHAETNLADVLELKNRSVEYELSSDTLGQTETIGQHVDLLTGFAFKSNAYSDAPKDIRLIRGDNIVQGTFRWDGVKRWPVGDRATYEKYELVLDDVLIAMDRTWISAGIKYAIVDEDALPSLLVQRVARLRAKQSILPRYLGYWVGSTIFEKYVLSIQTGLGVPHVSGSQIESFLIRVPPVAIQSAVVDRLDAISEKCSGLVSAYKQKLADLANLRQSLLQKAFSGQLT
jgi:type I restriction enzyme S subunit